MQTAVQSNQKIGDYYASCTDEKAIEDKGANRSSRGCIESRKSIPSPRSLTWLGDVTNNVMFRFESIQDSARC